MVSVKGGGSGQHWLWLSGIDSAVSEYSRRFFKISAASGFSSGLLKSATRPALSSIVPLALLIVLVRGPVPVGGSSRLNRVRPHWPESAGIEAEFSVPLAGQTSIAAEMNPIAARLACFPEMTLIFYPHHPSAWRLPKSRRSLRFSNLPPGNARVKHLVSVSLQPA